MGFQVLGKNQELAPGPQFFSFEHPAPDPGIRITGFYPDKTSFKLFYTSNAHNQKQH
jgi:hypothetical protein